MTRVLLALDCLGKEIWRTGNGARAYKTGKRCLENLEPGLSNLRTILNLNTIPSIIECTAHSDFLLPPPPPFSCFYVRSMLSFCSIILFSVYWSVNTIYFLCPYFIVIVQLVFVWLSALFLCLQKNNKTWIIKKIKCRQSFFFPFTWPCFRNGGLHI